MKGCLNSLPGTDHLIDLALLEDAGSHLAKNKTKEPDADTLFVQKHKSVLDKG